MIALVSGEDIDAIEVLSRSPDAVVHNSERTLMDCLSRSRNVQAATYDGVVAAMWGVIPPTLLSDRAYLWLLHTSLVEEHKFLFIRYSQKYVEEMLKIYPVLFGEVNVGNKTGQRWLKWLGAEFGARARGFIAFEIRRKDV